MFSRLIYRIQNLIYLAIVLLLGGLLINGEPIAFFIFAAWTIILAIAFLMQWDLLIKILLPDAKMVLKRMVNPINYRKAFWLWLALGFVLLMLGIYQSRF